MAVPYESHSARFQLSVLRTLLIALRADPMTSDFLIARALMSVIKTNRTIGFMNQSKCSAATIRL
jgi:hypothetical protein